MTQEQWETVTREYQAKSTYAQANLHQLFLDIRCAKGEDVQEFLASLCYKCKELAAARVPVTEKEYKRTILYGILSDLATFASQILSTVLIVCGTTSINIDTLINLINEEAEWLKSRHACRQSNQGRGVTRGEVFMTSNSEGKNRLETEVFMAEPREKR